MIYRQRTGKAGEELTQRIQESELEWMRIYLEASPQLIAHYTYIEQGEEIFKGGDLIAGVTQRLPGPFNDLGQGKTRVILSIATKGSKRYAKQALNYLEGELNLGLEQDVIFKGGGWKKMLRDRERLLEACQEMKTKEEKRSKLRELLNDATLL